MTVSLSPLPFQFLISSGSVAAGAKLFFYGAGGTTKQNTYTTSSGAVANSNPIILDSGGNLPNSGEVWFQNGQVYKVVLAPANDTDPPQSPYWTRDNLSGINDSTLSSVEWIGGPAPTFVNTTQFTVVGDQHLVLDVNRQVKLSVTSGTIYGYITASSYVSSVTTVTVSLYSGAVLDSGLSAVWYGLLDPAHPSCPSVFNSPVSVPPATAAGQAVNFGQWTNGSGWRKTPDGYIEQWVTFTGSTPAASAYVTQAITFPIAFPNFVSGAPVIAYTEATPFDNGLLGNYGSLTTAGCNVGTFNAAGPSGIGFTGTCWVKGK